MQSFVERLLSNAHSAWMGPHNNAQKLVNTFYKAAENKDHLQHPSVQQQSCVECGTIAPT
jgi:hypothetical protein